MGKKKIPQAITLGILEELHLLCKVWDDYDAHLGCGIVLYGAGIHMVWLEGCICLAVWLLQVIFSRNPAPAVHDIGCGCVVANVGELGVAKEVTGPQHLEDP